MKNYFFIFILINAFTTCQAQKMMRTVNDAVKLENNKQQFIGKPLKVLLDQIGPQIKAVYGNPDNKSGNSVGGTYFRFHFVDKTTFLKKQNENREPTSIIVNFKLESDNTRKPLPKGGITKWTDAETKEYGDMIIVGIRVKGKD